MKIASRANNEFRREFTTIESEGALSDGCDESHEKIRRLVPGPQCGQDGSVVVFRAEGVPSRTHRSDVRYNYYVQLEPYELLAGLASLPPDEVEAAVEKVFRSLRVAKQNRWLSEIPKELTPKDCGWPAPSDVIETANAIARGLVASLSPDADGPAQEIA